MPEVDQTQRPMQRKYLWENNTYYFVLEYVSTLGSLKQYSIGKIMRENYLKSEILENGDNYNLCWIASWFQLFRQIK